MNSKTEKKNKEQKSEFEYCKICKLNHNHGRRHNYFPNHVKSLSSFLSRFETKLSDVRFFLRNPIPLRPDLADRNRLWCVFCDLDVHEKHSVFACNKIINHMASAEHLKNLKHFMWKYGGGVDRLDHFCISEADLAKYEKKCKSLKSEVTSDRAHGPLIGPSNDIQNKMMFECRNNLENSNISFCNSTFSNGVLPLQTHTNENYQASHPLLPRVTAVGNSYSLESKHLGTNTSCVSYLTGDRGSLNSISASKLFADGSCSSGLMHQVYPDGETAGGPSTSAGYPKLTQISCAHKDMVIGNVHSGAPPPWLDVTNVNVEPQEVNNRPSAPLIKSGKPAKLNPKRVGAAWAERRKMEMEMEKRGQLLSDKFDANWLPNFGRVWQSGSRKESRKEFEVEIKKPIMEESRSETQMQLQPYISKRMRLETTE